jgi:NodT family efflux transporter outer membrane factor (OMF) lipoprotein
MSCGQGLDRRVAFAPAAAARGALAAALTALLASCAVGPNFKAPAAPQQRSYLPADLPAATASSDSPDGTAQRLVAELDIPGQWWTLFQSKPLNALIEQALANSPTLAAAQAALRQANENVAAERGSLYPSVSANITSERQRASGAEFGSPNPLLYTLNTASVSVSYGIDVFGGTRRQIEQLQAQADYQRYLLEASYLTLTSNIVTAAVTEASLRAQIAATLEIAQAQQAQVDILQRRIHAGGASRADLLQQQSTLATTLASLPPLRSQLAQQRNQLAVYTGIFPDQYAGFEFSLDALTLPAQLPVSLPSKLVEQRPDVQEYSALLHAATANIGVATANMLPQISISGSYGGAATRASDVFSPGSIIWSLVGSATQPIFKGGTLLHQRRAAVAAAQQAAANYQSTVLNAFQNVANTLVALQADAEALDSSATAAREAADSLSIVQLQFKSGGASYVQVLSAEQSYQTAEIAFLKARAQRFADTAALFQALGGGWWNRTDTTQLTSDCCTGQS